MKKVMVCFGTRPEIIKLAPVIKELNQNKKIKVVSCSTAQHVEMLEPLLKMFAIIPDYNLGVMTAGQSLSEISEKIFARLPNVLEKEKPDLVVVQGDTTSACCVAQVAFQAQMKVAHVEAGLRTHAKYFPYPEEINRKIIGQVADIHFAPTELARKNLLFEGINQEAIFVTGNTIVDALIELRPKLKSLNSVFLNKLKDRFILVTVHRRENHGIPLENICRTIRQIITKHKTTQIVFPVHLNPQVQVTVEKILNNIDNILLLPPLPYGEMLFLLERCQFVLTDSGGLQEEAPSFGKPVLVLRTVTERPEGVEMGIAKLVGDNPAVIEREASKLLKDDIYYHSMVSKINPYGDGKAAKRIAKIISKFFTSN
ncbi:MAG: UDP-N-acetylglucosamine 2-epimerase (non-hydrolyzing) [Legionella sp.]|nr:MAG: UDP-N-acetylglucosamine 2-epimerase (non-hydrolyzing) [Legionella sp.]